MYSIDSQIAALKEYETPDNDLIQFKLEGLNVLKQPHIVWQSSDLSKKRIIFNLVF
jgi:hypothetical protein